MYKKSKIQKEISIFFKVERVREIYLQELKCLCIFLQIQSLCFKTPKFHSKKKKAKNCHFAQS